MPESNDFQIQACYDLNATIASGQSASGEIDLVGTTLCGLIMPAAFTGVSVAIQMSPASGGTYVTLQDGEGADYTLAVTTNKFIPIPNLALTAGLRFIKIISSGTEAAERVIKLATRAV